MLQPIRIPTLQQRIAFVDNQGRLSVEAIRNLNDTFKAISDAVNGVISAQVAADAAQGTADGAVTDASAAQQTADSAYALADGKVAKSAGPAWTVPVGALARTYTGYVAGAISNPPTQSEVQSIANALQALSEAMVAVLTDLQDNEALTPP
jgi:hypothetical protein